MKIVVIGGTGLIGSKVVSKLQARGHKAIAASPNTGVNAVTGEGLREALAGAQVVVDVANSPTFEDAASLEFFQRAGHNLLAAEIATGVSHHVALSVVGTERLLDSGYFRAKMAQQQIIKAGSVPYTIVQSTQFFEFLGGIAQSGDDGTQIRLSPAALQPIAAEDVAEAVADAATAAPVNGIVEIAGPERSSVAGFVQRYLDAMKDTRKVVADETAAYFGVVLNEKSLVPVREPRLGAISFDTWFDRYARK
ncbi:SDR family oxidoreductase [Bordetella petrii]|uniref:SDR family oxidoreductase n=1 Tax=Bordetella petrii TaxID=94624 RepID=UPI001A967FED|nr:SDR family oxidoreductase [Bordetella petrii]MBO1114053.1 SDR family oxidoreductase [Bordetella petrii]